MFSRSLLNKVPWVPECPSTLQVPKCSLIARVPQVLKCLECQSALGVPFKYFKDFSEYMFYITVIVFWFLGSKMCKFEQVPLARYKSFKEVSKTFLTYFVKLQKTKYDGLQNYLLRKIVVSQLECTVLCSAD